MNFQQRPSRRSPASTRTFCHAISAAPLLTLVLLVGCDVGSTAPNLDAGGAALQLSQTRIELQSGDTTRLAASVVGANGRAQSATTIAWASSDPSVVDVSRSGLVLAKRSGEVLITAASGNLKVKSNVKVTGNRKSIVVSPKVDSLRAAGSLQLNATVLDPKGVVDPDTKVEWTSLSTDIASVNKMGKVTAVAAGVALITATSRGMVDTARVHVVESAPTVASIRVTPSSAALEVGKQLVLVAQAFDAADGAMGNAAFSWESSDTNIAAVDDKGTVTGIGAGAATITVRSDAVRASAKLSVQVPTKAPPPSTSTAAELPRVYVDTRMPAMSGNVIRVRAGEDLQAAINGAKRGDIVELEAGAEWRGGLTLPAKSGSGWVIIRTAGFAVPEGTRATPADAPRMARLVGTSTTASRRPLQVSSGATHYRLIGLEITYADEITRANATVGIDPGASHIVLDRVYVHGHDRLDLQRCVMLNAEHGAVIDSYLSKCHYKGQDSQAIIAWNTNGPLKIAGNYLEGAGENVMFGGAMSAEGVVPSDIEVRGNHFHKPISWRNADGTSKWSVKNLFEIKSAQRVLLEGNVFENNWKNGQDGMAFNVKVDDQGGKAPWNVARDITIRNNWITNVDGGVKLTGVERVMIENNVLDELDAFGNNGRLFQIHGQNVGIHIVHNTGFAVASTITAGGSTSGFVMRDNIVTRGRAGIKGNSVAEGTATLNANFPGADFAGNVLIGAELSRYPAGNSFPATVVDAGFQNYAAGDYRLAGASSLQSKASTATPGADIDQLRAAISGVVK